MRWLRRLLLLISPAHRRKRRAEQQLVEELSADFERRLRSFDVLERMHDEVGYGQPTQPRPQMSGRLHDAIAKRDP